MRRTRSIRWALVAMVPLMLFCAALGLALAAPRALAEEGVPGHGGEAASEERCIREVEGEAPAEAVEVVGQAEGLAEAGPVEPASDDEGLVVVATQPGEGALGAQAAEAHVAYRTHVQTYGWQGLARDGEVSGTSGQAKRLEGIELRLEGVSGSIQYRTHVQTYGWQGWRSDGQMSGTSGQAKRLEAIEVRLSGQAAGQYDVWYRVHAQTYGWMGWAKNGGRAGTATMGKRLEAIQVVLRPKGLGAPADPYRGVARDCAQAYATRQVQYRTHVQTFGWQGWSFDGETSGTSGQAKRLEAVEVRLADPLYAGSVQYRTHVQTYGWQGWVSDGAMSGTSGQAKRLEAIQVRLTGEMADRYDVWYRVHAQTFGWMGWAKNGASAGTEGWAKRLEAVEIVLTAKGSAAPGSTAGAFNKYVGKPYKVKYDLTGLKTEGGSGDVGSGVYVPGTIAEYRSYFGSRGNINVPQEFYSKKPYYRVYGTIPGTRLQIEYIDFATGDERKAEAFSIVGRLGDLVEGLSGKSLSLQELAFGLRSLRGEVDAVGKLPASSLRNPDIAKCGLCYVYEKGGDIHYADPGSRILNLLHVDIVTGGKVSSGTNAYISVYNLIYM